MTARVINDPSAVGWVFDPSSGRWLWEGSSGGGGGTGGDDPRISDTEITNWNTSFSWGNHADAGYLESETDPTVPDHVKAITTVDIATWNAGTGGGGGPVADPRISNEQIVHWDIAYGWGDHADAGYIDTETDPVFSASPAANINQSDINKWNAGTGGGGTGGDDPRITDDQIDNWDQAYNWGNHSSQGYATQSWVNNQSYATQAWVTNQNYATPEWVSQNYQVKGSYLTASSLNGYATESWVTSQGYLKTHQSLSGYATQTWVTSNYQAKGSYAASNHNHSGVYQPAGSYAASNHTHTEYAPASHSHSYASTNHNHSGVYAPASHSHAYVPTSGNTTVSGTLTATDFVASSDAGKKKNVVTAPVGLVEHLRGVEFEWKDTGKLASGVIAQEVQQVLPHLVHEGEDGLSVSYMGLIAYLIEEIKDMKQTIEAMK